jgi:predicted SnoaL-like aldol condensation-catalyzing enzyme
MGVSAPRRGVDVASPAQNKAVVRRFITELLAGGNLDAVDELLGPTYLNRGMGGMGRDDFKAMLPALATVMPVRKMEIEDLVAEGDAVVARFTFEWTLASAEKVTGRGLTYYRLADGRIVEDDPITTPDLTQALAAQLQPAAT